MTKPVRPVGLVHFGVLDVCPYCGGSMVPAFGEIVEDDGTRTAAIDPASARCRDCGALFPTAIVLPETHNDPD